MSLCKSIKEKKYSVYLFSLKQYLLKQANSDDKVMKASILDEDLVDCDGMSESPNANSVRITGTMAGLAYVDSKVSVNLNHNI